MASPIDALATELGWRAPGQEHNAFDPFLVDNIDDLLREAFPAFLSMRVRLMCSHCQARVEEEHATISPWCEETAIVRWCLEVWVIFLQSLVDVLQ